MPKRFDAVAQPLEVSRSVVALESRRGRLSSILPGIKMKPVSSDIARLAGELAEPFPGDPADRLIAATAIVTKAKLVAADQKIRQVSVVETIW